MSYRDLSTPLPGYAPSARLARGYGSRGSRPLSDGDLWAVCLPPVTSTPRRSITDHSCLKVYHKDPAQAFNHGGRPANGDARVSRKTNRQHFCRRGRSKGLLGTNSLHSLCLNNMIICVSLLRC